MDVLSGNSFVNTDVEGDIVIITGGANKKKLYTSLT